MACQTCSFKRFFIGYSILLLLTPLLLQLISFASSAPVPLRATMSVSLVNISNDTTFNVQYFFRVRDYQNTSRIRFFNITSSMLQAPNGTFLGPIEDGSGFTLYLPEWHSTEYVQFQVDNINISSDFPVNFSSLSMVHPISYDISNESLSFEFRGTLTVIGRTHFSTHSIASLHQFTYEGIAQPVEMRIQVTEYSKGFFIFLYLFTFLIPLSIWSPKSRERLPFATFVLVLLMVFLYAFVGSGREIESTPPFAWNFFKNWPFGFLMHTSDIHLFGNLAVFIPLSLLLEGWLHVKGNLRRFATWYILPILLEILLAWSFGAGVGFSIANELFAWALWSLIIVERKTKTRLDLLLCIFSGVLANTFFNWLFGYLPHIFSTVASTWWGYIAQRHIFLGLVGVFVFGVITLVVLKEQAKDYCTRPA